jgi:hypothetical protein
MWVESACNLILQVTPPYPPRGRSGGGGSLPYTSFIFLHSNISFPSPLPPGGGRGGGRGGAWGGGGGSEEISYIPILQFTITKLLKLPWGDLSMYMANLPIHTYTGQIYAFFLLFSLPRGGIVGNLTPALLPFRLTRGLGLGVGLAGSSPGFRPCLCTGGIGDQGTTLTHETTLTHPTLDALGNPYLIESQLTPNSRPSLDIPSFLTFPPRYFPTKTPLYPYLETSTETNPKNNHGGGQMESLIEAYLDNLT